MKKTYILLLLLLMTLSISAQIAQQHQPPPTNNYPYTRGMFVDCTNEIITDMRNGNPLAAFDELKTYIRENFIEYIALYDLDRNLIIGKPVLEQYLKQMIIALKIEFPQLRIGVVGKKADHTIRTRKLKASDYFTPACLVNSPYTLSQLDSMINYVGNAEDMQRSETIKFFLRSIDFTKTFVPDGLSNCKSPVKVFYFEDRYWKDASSGTMNQVKSKFESYKSILRLLQMLKCHCNDISIESEFEPTNYFRLQGWTITDQIEQADPLIDKMMIPFYTSPFNANGAYDINCKLLHLLSDQFSKNGTTFYTGFSAQSNSFTFCNSSTTPMEHLGRYLMGIIPMASGNMYSVEKGFLDKLNDPAYMCAGCSCYGYLENQYSPSNPTANMCVGSMWYPYSMLKNNGLFRKGAKEVATTANSIDLQIKSGASHFDLTLTNGELFTIVLYDVQGRKIAEERTNAPSHTFDIAVLKSGTYFLNAISISGKHFNRVVPVLHR
jgi:hypothetical protein